MSQEESVKQMKNDNKKSLMVENKTKQKMDLQE